MIKNTKLNAKYHSRPKGESSMTLLDTRMSVCRFCRSLEVSTAGLIDHEIKKLAVDFHTCERCAQARESAA